MSYIPPKRHHYIPKMLLRNFVGDDGLLCVFDKNRSDGKLYSTGLENLFVEQHRYRRLNFDTKRYDYIFETTLSDMESRAAPVVQKIIERARNGERPALSPDEKNAWIRFYLASSRRSPETAEEALDIAGYDELFPKVVALWLRQEGLPPIDINDPDWGPKIESTKQKMKHNTKALLAAGLHPALKDQEKYLSQNTGLRIAVICRRNRSFVIGSRAIALVEPTRRNPAQGAWLPIAHDVAVAATAFPDREILLRLDDSRDWFIKEINRASFRQSQIVAGRSEALIRSLAKG